MRIKYDPDDPAKYERQVWEEYKAVVQELRAWPEFRHVLVEPPFETGPVVGLLCSKRHLLLNVVLDRDGNWNPYLRPVRDGQSPERGSTVAIAATPWSGRGFKACAEPGCPEIVGGGLDFCTLHTQVAPDAVGDTRTRFTCERCGPRHEGSVRQATLLKYYAMAVKLQQRTIPLPL